MYTSCRFFSVLSGSIRNTEIESLEFTRECVCQEGSLETDIVRKKLFSILEVFLPFVGNKWL